MFIRGQIEFKQKIGSSVQSLTSSLRAGLEMDSIGWWISSVNSVAHCHGFDTWGLTKNVVSDTISNGCMVNFLYCIQVVPPKPHISLSRLGKAWARDNKNASAPPTYSTSTFATGALMKLRFSTEFTGWQNLASHKIMFMESHRHRCWSDSTVDEIIFRGPCSKPFSLERWSKSFKRFALI